MNTPPDTTAPAPPPKIKLPQRPKRAKRPKGPNIQVWLSQEDKEAIQAKAKAHGRSASSYLRALGMNHPVKSIIDHQRVMDLVRIAGDQGRLGGLLKLWLTNPEKVFDFQRVRTLLEEIEALQKVLADQVDQFIRKAG